MSRIGKMPIILPKEVTVSNDFSKVEVTGPKGHLAHPLSQGISVSMEGGALLIHRGDDQRTSKALQGLTRSLVSNMVTGVTKGFEKRLEIIGIGFRADLQGKGLKLTLGFSHPILFPLPEGIKVDIEKQTQITVKGIDKQQVGSVAAKLRSIKPPEPYKGKGIRYAGERIRKKVGKTKA
ncbi:MAG: 50S ribosomal protein L6 [Deltaproteobacteria bacterium RBG_13_47_9]|nr:MAG: 50S ribosomal protein L6 [Deltaproteobacteria bacterium RBG_13_47_9]